MGEVDDPGRGRHAAAPSAPPGPPTAQVPGRHRARGSLDRLRAVGRWPLAVLALVVVVVVAVVAVTTTRDPDEDTSAHAGSGRELAGWAAAQLPPGATLTADPTVATALEDAGVAAGLLTTAASVTADQPGPALQVVQDDDAGGMVVASFSDAGGRLVVIDPAAVPPDEGQLDQRRRLGAALLENPMTQAPAAAAERLRAGEVDPRLLTLLAGMAARFGVQLADLPAAAGEPPGSAARAAVLGSIDGRPVADGTAELAELRTYLAAQQDPFSPDEVQLVDGGLLLHFRYITDPDGAVTGGGG